MTTFFDWLMFILFGKRWVLHKMKNDYKIAIFMKELDLSHQMSRYNESAKRVEDLKMRVEEAENSELGQLTPAQQADKQLKYETEKKLKANKKQRIETAKKRLKSAETEMAMADGEVNRLNAENYKVRLRYDFIRTAKPKATYADLNK
jgi:hypothetical protein